MSVTSLTTVELVQNISNAFVGTVNDMYRRPEEEGVTGSATENILVKENRHLYLALLFLMITIIGMFMFE